MNRVKDSYIPILGLDWNAEEKEIKKRRGKRLLSLVLSVVGEGRLVKNTIEREISRG